MEKNIEKIYESITYQILNIESLIDECGEIKVISKPKGTAESQDYYHDFVYFVLTKSCKTLSASMILTENLYSEDSQILIRSVYENYLSLKHLSKNMDDLYHFLTKTVGLAAGIYTHPISKKGNIQRTKLFDPKTGETSNFGLSISRMAESMDSKNEQIVHKTLYPYLCELTHLNMMSSGNYRNKEETKYTYRSSEPSINPYIFIPYVLILLCDFLTCDVGLYNKVIAKKIFKINKEIKKHLLKLNTGVRRRKRKVSLLPHYA